MTTRGEWMVAHGLTRKDLAEWGVTINDDGNLVVPVGEQYQVIREFNTAKRYEYTHGCRHGFSLYGLDRAIDAIDDGFLFLVEGFSDCITAHKAGVRNTVSILTSHMTKTQWQLARVFADNIIVWLDGDQTGIDHAHQLIKQFPQAMTATVYGYDPAELYAKRGAEFFGQTAEMLKSAFEEFSYLELSPALSVRPSSKRRESS